MPAAGFLLMSSNISFLPLCFCFASCNVSRETTALTSVLHSPHSDRLAQVRTPALTRTVQVSFVFCLLFFKWSGRVKLWYPAPWVGNTNVPHSAERKGELACVSRFLTYVMASSRMGDHGRTHKGQANEICARGVRIFCRCMRPPKS